MEPRYSITLAEEHHVRSIPAIEQAAAAIFSEDDLPAEVRFLVTDPDTLIEAQDDDRLWVALEYEQKVVGFALARVLDENGHLEEIGVYPEHAGQGIGSRLLDAVIDWAEAHGLPGVTLITFRHLPWNAPFYEGKGFAQLDGENISTSMRNLIREEAKAGIEPRNRVAMSYAINGGNGSGGARRPA